MEDGMRNDAVDQALGLGLPCFPCRNTPGNEETDKSPFTSSHGFKDASADPNEIRKMFSPHPGCLIGVPTGSISRIDILDVDPRHNGHVWYEANKARLPPTRIHRTRSGGLHRLFRHMPGLRNTTGKIAPGIDTRAEGGYCIWWPATGLEFQDYPPTGLPEWPLWLLPAMMSKPVPPPPYRRGQDLDSGFLVAKVSGLARTLANSPEGSRNNLCNWAGYAMRQLVASGQADAERVAYTLARAATCAGLSFQEAERAVRSGMGWRHG
jgi:hypothetical protein